MVLSSIEKLSDEGDSHGRHLSATTSLTRWLRPCYRSLLLYVADFSNYIYTDSKFQNPPTLWSLLKPRGTKCVGVVRRVVRGFFLYFCSKCLAVSLAIFASTPRHETLVCTCIGFLLVQKGGNSQWCLILQVQLKDLLKNARIFSNRFVDGNISTCPHCLLERGLHPTRSDLIRFMYQYHLESSRNG